MTGTGFYRCCAPGASAPVVVKKQSPKYRSWPDLKCMFFCNKNWVDVSDIF